MITKVNVEGTYFLYVTDPLTRDFSGYDIRYSANLFKYFGIVEIENVRLILDEWTIPIKSNSYAFSYLYWYKPIDLKWVDNKVLNGDASGEDFENSIKCEFHTHERCTHCKEVWDVLAVDAVLYYNENKALGKTKIAKAREAKIFLKCPACNSAFAESYVVKIFGQSLKQT